MNDYAFAHSQAVVFGIHFEIKTKKIERGEVIVVYFLRLLSSMSAAAAIMTITMTAMAA
jgi:hypothetical protein